MPNPFSSNVEVRFDAETTGNIEIRVYSVTGHLVFSDTFRASNGENRYVLRGMDNRGNRLSSGVYFLRLQSGSAVAVSKLVIAR